MVKVVDLGECVSISTGVDKNAFLVQVRAEYPRALSHGNNLQAAEAVEYCGGGALVGHGMPGELLTGGGDLRTAGAELTSQAIDMPPCERLTLCGCNVGAGSAGADLLNWLVSTTGATVRAPVGLVYLGQVSGVRTLYLERGTDWQLASPTIEAKPIEPPPLFQPSEPAVVRLFTTDGPVDLSPSNVVGGGSTSLTATDASLEAWAASDVQRRIQCVDWANPFRPGAVAAVYAGQLQLTIRSGDAESRRTFWLYNDSLVVDALAPEVTYRANLPALL